MDTDSLNALKKLQSKTHIQPEQVFFFSLDENHPINFFLLWNQTKYTSSQEQKFKIKCFIIIHFAIGGRGGAFHNGIFL